MNSLPKQQQSIVGFVVLAVHVLYHLKSPDILCRPVFNNCNVKGATKNWIQQQVANTGLNAQHLEGFCWWEKDSASMLVVAWFQAWIRVEVPAGDKLEDEK